MSPITTSHERKESYSLIEDAITSWTNYQATGLLLTGKEIQNWLARVEHRRSTKFRNATTD